MVTSLGSDPRLFPRFNHIAFQILSLVDAILVVSIFFCFSLSLFFSCVHFYYHFLLSDFFHDIVKWYLILQMDHSVRARLFLIYRIYFRYQEVYLSAIKGIHPF